MTSLEQNRINELLHKYYMYKEKQKDIEEELRELRKDINDTFKEYETDVIKTKEYEASLKTVRSMRLSKADVPEDIYEEYAKEVVGQVLQVTKRGQKAKRRSRSRSR